MAIERFELDTEQWAALSQKAASAKKFLAAFDERDFGGMKSEFPQPHDAKHLAIALDYISEFIEIAAAPRPEAGQQSDAFLVWLPRLIAEYEKQARHNEFTPDVSLDFVKRALAEYQHAAKQPTPRPVPTCDWQEDADGIWETSCGEAWVCTEGTPAENDMRFCHSCGKHLKEHRHAEPDGGAV